MSDQARHTDGEPVGTTYRITVKGVLDDRWSSWFDGLRITQNPNGDTELAGSIRDQTALHGLLAKIRDLGLTLVSVEPRQAEVTRARQASSDGGRSPVPSIGGAILLGLAIAVALVFGPAVGSSEATITGAVLLAFAVGWAVMAYATTRFSTQPQRWTVVPATGFGLVGLALIVAQPGSGAIDVMSWIWPIALAVLTSWMAIQARASLAGRGRWLVYPLMGVLALSSIGGAIATGTQVLGAGAVSPTGQLVNVGNRRLHIDCHGTGTPVVVLQAGLGGTAADWERVMAMTSASTTVCAYDRAGHGWSDPAPREQDGTAIATDLHTLLERAGIRGPFVLVGHSSGGPYTRVFADRYPDEVAGIVLVDAQPNDPFTELPDYPAFYAPYRAIMSLAPSIARLGLGILAGSPSDPSGIGTARFMRDEVVALPDALRQARSLTTIGDRPLLIVTAGAGQQRGWLAAQDRLTSLSTNVAHRVMPMATHDSLITGDDAGATARAVLDVVAAVRTGQPVR